MSDSEQVERELLAKLASCESDLDKCILTLVEIWNEEVLSPAEWAQKTLKQLTTATTCPFCEGTKKVPCKCKGGGTTEHRCYRCENAHEVACRACEGEGQV